jgi:hypothetical protein
MVVVSDISGVVLPTGTGATVRITFRNGRSDLELHLTDEEVKVLVEARIHGLDSSKPPTMIERIRQVHPRAYTPWSAEEESQLAHLHAEGQSPAEIGKVLERQSSAIRARLHRLGLLKDAGDH